MYRHFFKPLIDFLSSFLGLIILSPLLILVAIVLSIQNKGTPFFLQTRPGKDQKAFKIIKFKTMTDERGPDGQLLPDADRITPFGRIIRQLSIDELPQLINVLKGDMSLVGPRPLLFKYIPLYSEDQLRRHEVRPGITGLAQVNGRNAISWSKKLEFDVKYVDNVVFLEDIKILFKTIQKVLQRDGINQSPDAPMEPFNGKN